MNNDIFKNNRFNKISRNGILENDKFGIIKKFGFMSSFLSTTLQSKTKSFNESKNNFNTIDYSNKKLFTNNKSFISKINQSLSKPIILKTKSIKKISPITKEDISLKKCPNIFSYTQKINFKTDKKKAKPDNISKNFLNSYTTNKNTSKQNNSNDTTVIKDEKKNKSRIKSIIFNKSMIIKEKNRKKLASYEKAMNRNFKLKYKFLFGKEKVNNINVISNKKDSNISNTMTLVSDENSASTKKEKFNIFKDDQTYKNSNENNSIFDFEGQNKKIKKKNNEIEKYYYMNDKMSSEVISEKYNRNDIIEQSKNFNLDEENSRVDDNLCQLDQDISEKRSNDNNLDKNSNTINNINNNNFILFSNKNNDIDGKYNIRKNYLFTKLSNLLKNNDSCNISPRNDYNEISKIYNDKQMNEKTYKFISDIQTYTDKLPILNIKKFLNLKDYGLYTLMGFIYNSSNLIKTNSAIVSKIKKSFINIFSETINSFSNTYSSFLKVENYYFENRKIIINKKPLYIFNLVIICKVITKDTNKSYDISYNYIANDKEYDNLWKIDILKKSNIKIWLNTELYKENSFAKIFTYGSQISSFSYGDEIKFEINIFNQRKQLNPYSIKWLPPEITDIENNNFEANKFISNSKFDPLRCNEIEIQTLIWKEIFISDNNDELVKDFIKIFEKNFIIKKIDTYTSKHVFYKIKAIANKKGIFAKNKYLFFDLNIIDYNEPLKNEVQSIYLMNSNYYNKKMDIRLGTLIFFYITDIQS